VVASFGRRYDVELSHAEIVSCVTRGKRGEIACGDRVTIAMTATHEGVIEKVEPRISIFFRSDIQRQKLIAANVTQIAIVLAPHPPFHPRLVDRCLAAAESAHIRALIALNKTDLGGTAEALEALELYRALGYEVLSMAAKIDLTPLRERLAGFTSVLVGQSGMGKSTIINRLLPDARARVGELSGPEGGGRHTTTHARLYHLDAQSAIIDSPGLQEFGLYHLTSDALEQAFIEFRPHIGHCRFNDCLHMAEPGCAISAAAAHGEIHPQRIESYRELKTQQLKQAKPWD
jgi:ribosome biogenesis GTPase